MSSAAIKQVAGNIKDSLSDNPLALWGLVIGCVLMAAIFGGLLFHAYLDWKHERQKAQAVERLQKHLQNLPSQKS